MLRIGSQASTGILVCLVSLVSLVCLVCLVFLVYFVDPRLFRLSGPFR